MNTEQIKLLLDAVSMASAAGKEAFFWWLFADKIIPYIMGMFVFGIAGLLLWRLISRLGIDMRWDQIRSHFGYNSYNDSNYEKTLTRIIKEFT